MWSDDTTGVWDGGDAQQDVWADTTFDPTVDELPELTPLDALAPEDATDILVAPDVAVPAADTTMAGVPSDLDLQPRFGSLNGPDGVTDDAAKEPYDYLHSSGQWETPSGRVIDPWTGAEKK